MSLNNQQWLICHKTKQNRNYMQTNELRFVYKMLSTKYVYKSYLIYMYKEDMVLYNLQRLICHKNLTSQLGFVKLLASSGSHCTKWADQQHRQAGFKSRLVPDLPLPFIPTLIGLRAFDLVSSRVWWEAATNTQPTYTC